MICLEEKNQLIYNYIYNLSNSINKKYVTYSSSLVVLKDNEAKKAKDLKNYKIGILKDKKSFFYIKSKMEEVL